MLSDDPLKLAPTPDEAVVFWLNAAGLTMDQISSRMGKSKKVLRGALARAKDLARLQRIWYVSTKTKESVPASSGSGMSYLKQLAAEAGLK